MTPSAPRLDSRSAVAFEATLQRVGIDIVAEVPARASAKLARASVAAGRSKGAIPVQAKLPGSSRSFPQTLVPIGGGRHKLYVNEVMLGATGLVEGQRVRITLTLDLADRMAAMPAQLADALAASDAASATFDALSPSRRKEVLRYLTNLKTQAALERNVAKFVAKLAGGEMPFRAPGQAANAPSARGQSGARTSRKSAPTRRSAATSPARPGRQVPQKYADVDAYLASLPEPAAATLRKVRQAIHDAVPDVEERIAYHMPYFRRGTRSLGVCAFTSHWSLFGSTRDLLAAVPELEAYSSGKGTLRFPHDEPIPMLVVRRLVKFQLGA